jgi:CRISPR/Cas system-associated protein Cas7 (RAMP superfamily)
MSERDDVPTVDPEVSAHWWAQKLVEGLVESGASPNEVKDAIDKLTKHAIDMAKIALGRREASGNSSCE